MKDKYIVLIVGESGSGKSTICDELTKRYDLKQVKSYTTRPRRSANEDGHTFISNDEFSKLENICAYTYFDNHHYCATKEQVDNADLYIIDPYGIRYFIDKYNGRKIPMVVYIHADNRIRRKRMEKRGDKRYKIQQRIVNDESSFANVDEYATYQYNNIEEGDVKKIATDIYRRFFRDSLGDEND